MTENELIQKVNDITTDYKSNIFELLHDAYISGYQRGVDEFSNLLISDEIQLHTLDMVFETSRDLSYSDCIDVFEEYVNECAKQIKEQKND